MHCAQIVYPDEGVAIKPLNSLEDFIGKLRLHLLEKVIYSKAQTAPLVFFSEEVPPVIAPVLQANTVVNTELSKKSVYLEKNKEAIGTVNNPTAFKILCLNTECVYLIETQLPSGCKQCANSLTNQTRRRQFALLTFLQGSPFPQTFSLGLFILSNKANKVLLKFVDSFLSVYSNRY